ncbi:MAG: hypothetical protein WBV46_17070 [Terriglobales bacterium]
MASGPSPQSDFPRQSAEPATSAKRPGLRLKGFLTTVMGLLSVLVIGLGFQSRNMLWLWIGLICALISGVFVQMFVNHREEEEKEEEE